MSMGFHKAYAQLPHGQLHYRYWISGEQPALVLLHQTPSDSEMFAALAPMLAPHFNLFAPDTPGFGMSDGLPAPYQFSDLVDAIAQWLNLLGLNNLLLFGHHTGAALATALAARLPRRIRAVSLCGPTLLTEAQKTMLQTAGNRITAQNDGRHLASLWQRIQRKDTDAPARLVQREMLAGERAGSHWGDTYRAVIEVDTAALLQAIQCPVQVMAGPLDPLHENVAPTLALLKRGVHTELPADAGTYVCDRQPALLARELTDFFLPLV